MKLEGLIMEYELETVETTISSGKFDTHELNKRFVRSIILLGSIREKCEREEGCQCRWFT